MTNSVQVFPAGFRLTDSSTGSPLSGATIEFYDAGTTTAKTVYADQDLTTSLGTVITTDSLGYPSTGGSKTLIYVGTSSYKIVIKTSTGTTIAEHDNIKGAADVYDPTTVAVSPKNPVVTLAQNTTLNITTHQNNIVKVNCTGVDLTFTLPSAVTAGDGWAVTIQHAGASNKVVISTQSSQAIKRGVTNYGTTFNLLQNGDQVKLVSNGSDWTIANLSKASMGFITVVKRATTPPATANPGDYFLLSGSGSGGWAGLSQHSIAEYISSTNNATSTPANWAVYVPSTDCGWTVYNQDENKNYQYQDSAWVSLSASQSDMETATSSVNYVTPAVVKNHPGVAKFWAHVTISGGTVTTTTSYNCTVARNSSNTGLFDVTLTTPFSSANYAVVASPDTTADGLNNRTIAIVSGTRTTSSFRLRVENTSFAAADPTAFYVCGFGDQ